MRRHATSLSCASSTVAAVAWLAVVAVPCPAQQESERQTRLILPKATTQTGPALMLQSTHTGPATCVSLRADGAKLVSGGVDGYAIIYDVETGVVERTFPSHPTALTSVSLSVDGQYLACGLANGEVVIWDLTGESDPEVVADGLVRPQVRFAPEGPHLALWGQEPQTATRSHVMVWDTTARSLVSSLEVNDLLCVAFGADGNVLRVVDLDDITTLTLSPRASPAAVSGPGLRNWSWQRPNAAPYILTSGVLNPAGTLLALRHVSAAGGDQHAEYLWRTFHLGPRAPSAWTIVDLAAGRVTTSWEQGGHTALFARDEGALLGAGDARAGSVEARVTDLVTGGTRPLEARPVTLASGAPIAGACVEDMAISTDGRRATAAWSAAAGATMMDSGNQRPVVVGATTWDLSTGDQLSTWCREPVREAILGLTTEGGGCRLRAAVSSRQDLVWDFTGQTPPLRGQSTLAILMRRKLLREIHNSEEDRAGLVALGHSEARGPVYPQRGPLGADSGDGVFSVFPDGPHLVLSEPGRVVAHLKRHGITVGDDLPGTLWVAPDRRAAAVARLATFASGQGLVHTVTVRRWSLPDGELLGQVSFPAASVPQCPCPLYSGSPSLSFSRDGRFVVGALGHSPAISVWDLAAVSEPLCLEGHGGPVLSACFAPDSRTLCAGGADGTVTLWDAATGRLQSRINGHFGAVTSVRFIADGRLATGSLDGSIALWDTRHWLLRAALRRLPGTPMRWVADPVAGILRSLAVSTMGWDPGSRVGAGAESLPPPPLSAVLYAFAPPPGLHPNLAAELGLSLLDSVLLEPDGTVQTHSPDWLVAIPQGCYDCSPGASSRVAWMLGDRVYPFDQFEGATRRPDVVRSVLAGRGIPRDAALGPPHAPPTVEFLSPEYGATVSRARAEVTIAASGSAPIQRVALTANGRALEPRAAAQLIVDAPTETSRSFTCEAMMLGSETRLRAVAYDVDGFRSRPAELLLRGPVSGPVPEGGLLVLSIGVSKYANAAWNTIQYAGADAQALADLLARQGTPVRDRQVLVDEAATVSSIKFALRHLKDTANENDTAAVFIAGHGVQGPRGEYYFLCHDSEDSDLPITALPWRDFVSVLAETRARRVVLLADTCHSGSVTGRDETQWRVDRLNREGGVLVFAASQGDEPSIEGDEWGHGAFTYALLEGLKGAADQPGSAGAPMGDGVITVSELASYLQTKVTQATGGRQHPLVRLDQLSADEAVILDRRPN